MSQGRIFNKTERNSEVNFCSVLENDGTAVKKKKNKSKYCLSQFTGIRWRGQGEVGGVDEFCEPEVRLQLKIQYVGQGRYLMKLVAITKQLCQQAGRAFSMPALEPRRKDSVLSGALSSQFCGSGHSDFTN